MRPLAQSASLLRVGRHLSPNPSGASMIKPPPRPLGVLGNIPPKGRKLPFLFDYPVVPRLLEYRLRSSRLQDRFGSFASGGPLDRHHVEVWLFVVESRQSAHIGYYTIFQRKMQYTTAKILFAYCIFVGSWRAVSSLVRQRQKVRRFPGKVRHFSQKLPDFCPPPP